MPNVLIDFKATPDSVQFGGSTVLTWNVENANKCTAGFDWSGEKLLTGSQIISNLEKTSIFSLTCTNVLGEKVSKSVDVGVYIVDNFEPSIKITAPDIKGDGTDIISPGQKIQVKWETKNAGNNLIAVGLVYSKKLEGNSWERDFTALDTNLVNDGETTLTIPSVSELKSLNLKYDYFTIGAYIRVENPEANPLSALVSTETKNFIISIPCDEGYTGTYPNCKKIETPPIECPAGYTGQYPNCVKIETPSPSCLELTYNLKITDRDSFTKGEVSKLQNFLKLQGYLNENPTGYFGTATLGAVIKFQKANNISPAVGFVGSYTRAKIKEISCSATYGSGANNNSVKVISPNGGELFRPLDQVEVKFKVKDLENNKYKIALAYYPTNNSQPILLSDINKNNGNIDNIDIQLPFLCRIGNLQELSFPGSYNSPEAEEEIKHSLQLEGCGGVSSFPASSWTSDSLLELELFMPPLSLIVDKNNLSFDSSEYQKINDLNRLHLYDFTGKKFKLFIQELDKNGKIIGEDYSDDFFSILPQDLKEGCVQGIDYNKSSIKCPSIKINTNNEVKNYKPGEKIEVSWASKNIPKNAWVALSLQDQNTKIKYFIASYLPASEKITYFFPENIKQNDIADGESIGHVYERLVNKNFKVVADLYLGSGSIYAFDYNNIIQSAVPVNFGGIITNSPSIILKPHLLASDSSDNTFKMLPLSCFNGIQDFGETGIDVGGPCGEIFNSCPEGTTGAYPNCKEIVPECPEGYTGIYPNCVLPQKSVSVNSSISGCELGYKYSVITGQPCSLQTQTTDNSDSITTTTTDKTPRIAYWSGKVNQHIDQNGNWQTDPDGASGSSLDKLGYCRKWYPTTTSVRDYKVETINTWRAGGNTGAYSSSRMTIECVGGSVAGVLGASTDKNPNLCSLDANLMKGMKSPKVKCLQQKLNQKGYQVVGTEGGKETNEFGYYTMQALRKFQKDNNLTADGILGKNTRKLLNN